MIGSFRFTWCVAFAATLQQLNDMAAQREDLADCLHTQIACDLTRYTQELKAERKTVSRGPSCGSGGHSRMSWRSTEASLIMEQGPIHGRGTLQAFLIPTNFSRFSISKMAAVLSST